MEDEFYEVRRYEVLRSSHVPPHCSGNMYGEQMQDYYEGAGEYLGDSMGLIPNPYHEDPWEKIY